LTQAPLAWTSSPVEHLKARKGERLKDAGGKVRKHILPVLGGTLVSDLAADDGRRWHSGMVRGKDDDAPQEHG
jgi:hypothetical protein